MIEYMNKVLPHNLSRGSLQGVTVGHWCWEHFMTNKSNPKMVRVRFKKHELNKAQLIDREPLRTFKG